MKKPKTSNPYCFIDRPNIALITNHGYGGVTIPFGSALDTGGQNVYVNSYARALDKLGYKVTIYARGGFPFFESERIRSGEEYLTKHIRYVYVPGGGNEFIRKEDIATALIEQVEWMYNHINEEAKKVNVFPWQYYDMMNTHYWDAGVIGVSLIVKWQNDLCARMIELLSEEVVTKAQFKEHYKERHYHSISKAPAYSLGKLLLDSLGDNNYVHEEEIMLNVYNKWSQTSPLAKQIKEEVGRHIDWLDLRSTVAAATIQLRPLVLAEVLGTAVLEQKIHSAVFEDPAFQQYRVYSEMETFNDVLSTALERVNRHVWTPHSLGVIKEWNFRSKSNIVKRNLKFRERRSHERMICDYTPAFASTSYEIAETLVANYGAKIDDVVFFPPGVDIDIFHDYGNGDIEHLCQYLKKKTNLDIERMRSSTIILETSRMDETKRKDVVLKAFKKIISNNNDCLLFMSGGPKNEVFNSLQKILDYDPLLKERAHLLGFVEEEYLPLLFSFCDIYISASEMEGFGMAVAQAAVDGKPVVSSDKIPFTSFYIKKQAIIAPAGDVDKFAEGLEFLVKNKDERIARGKKIKKKALRLEWENLTIQFLLDLNVKNFNIPITEYITEKLPK